MDPIESLKQEHKLVQEVLDTALHEAEQIKKTGKINLPKISMIIDFSRNFTDGCHHVKEQNYLFPKLSERLLSQDTGPVTVMLHEHTEGKKLLEYLSDNLAVYKSGNLSSVNNIWEALENYVILLKNHINKENNVLFHLAEQVLTPEDREQLEEEFNRFELTETGEGIHEKYHHLAHEIIAI